MNLPSPLFPRDKFHSYFEHSVYEPAEDTFLLLDAIEKTIQSSPIPPSVCLEIGCGSGAVIVALKKALGSASVCIATDANKFAAECTSLCACVNGIAKSIDIVVADLAGVFADRLAGSVDLLLFNPPYVATPSEELGNSSSLQASWAGGADGMEVTTRFIDQANRLLSPHGQFLLVLEKVNQPEQVLNEIHSKYPTLTCEIIMDRKCGIEHLFIVRGVQK